MSFERCYSYLCFPSFRFPHPKRTPKSVSKRVHPTAFRPVLLTVQTCCLQQRCCHKELQPNLQDHNLTKFFEGVRILHNFSMQAAFHRRSFTLDFLTVKNVPKILRENSSCVVRFEAGSLPNLSRTFLN